MSGRLRLRVVVVIEPDGDGYYAYCPALKGLHAAGDTEDEAVEGARVAALAYLESMVAHGEPIPSGTRVQNRNGERTRAHPSHRRTEAPGVVVAYSSATWNQLKGLTLKELAKALKRDGWTEETAIRGDGRVHQDHRQRGCQPTASGVARASGKELRTPSSEGAA